MYSTDSLLLDGEVLRGIAMDVKNERTDYIVDQLPALNYDAEIGPAGSQYRGQIIASAIEAWYPDGKKSTLEINPGQEFRPIQGPEQKVISWEAKKYGVQAVLPREVSKIAESRAIDAIRYALAPAVNAVEIGREKQALDEISGWSVTRAAGAAWDTAGGDPVGDIMGAIGQVDTYATPDSMILSADAARCLMSSQAFLSTRSLLVDRATLRLDEMAEIIRERFGLRRVLISRARASAASGGSRTVDYMLSKTAWIGRLDLEGYQTGSNYSTTAAAAVRIVPQGIEVEAVYDPARQSQILCVSACQAFARVYPELGVRLTGIL